MTTQTIPISSLISVTPSALAAGGGVNQLVGLIITQNTSAVPDSTVQSFGTLAAVGTAFGASSAEYQAAATYFSGTSIAQQRPAQLLFAGYGSNEAAMTAQYLNTIAALGSFAGFTTAWAATIADRQTIAQWVSSQNSAYWYVSWEPGSGAAVSSGGAGSFGTWLQSSGNSGTTAVVADEMTAGACLGWMASLDFSVPNGRSTLAWRNCPALVPDVTYSQYALNLTANGYTYYGLYANGSQQYQIFYNGAVSGPFLWADSYVCQIWLNANLQEALVNLLSSVNQVPFNSQGDSLVSAALQGVINQALSFGAIRAGVALTSLQQQIINGAAGNNTAAQTVQTRGWYLIPGASTAAASIRQARGPITPVLYYTDGESVQTINLSSVEVQ